MKNKNKRNNIKCTSIEVKRNPTHFKTRKKQKFDWKGASIVVITILLFLTILFIYSHKYNKTRDDMIKSFPAYAIGYVDNAIYKCCYNRGIVKYHFFVNNERYNGSWPNPIDTVPFFTLGDEGKNAHKGDSILIKYCSINPNYSIVVDIIEKQQGPRGQVPVTP